jgi:hypothetical protein
MTLLWRLVLMLDGRNSTRITRLRSHRVESAEGRRDGGTEVMRKSRILQKIWGQHASLAAWHGNWATGSCRFGEVGSLDPIRRYPIGPHTITTPRCERHGGNFRRVIDGAHNHYEVFGGTLSKHMRFAAMWAMYILLRFKSGRLRHLWGIVLSRYLWQVVVRPDVEELRLATTDRGSLPKKREQARPR